MAKVAGDMTGMPLPNTGTQQANNAKLEALQKYHTHGVLSGSGSGKCPFLTSQLGVKIYDDDHSLKAGARGPVALEDQFLREKINHFDHERIPERVVHARGTGAHGHFELYESQEAYTTARVLTDTKLKTPVFVRFSTVLGSRGSMDTARDVRGFATKFYTPEGNWDLVGNNIPVFFIQDAIKFPDVVHAGKPEPQLEMPQASTAHDNFWDYLSWTPEATHMTSWILSDRAIPRSYRMMQGFGVNTFVLINAAGKRTFVKFHWKPLLGIHGLAWDEAMKLGGVDTDFHRRDLYDAITKGNFPQWELGLQLVSEEDEHKFDFDLLDDTKIIPEELVPVKYIGKMTLDRLPTDFFAEVEQIAFCTQNIVPGMDFSNDPMLQGRNFSYLDTQLTRLGSVNFNQIPINQTLPECQVANYQRDGHMQMQIPTDKLNYYPNRFTAKGDGSHPAAVGGGEHPGQPAPQKLSAEEIRMRAMITYRERMEGMKERVKAPKFLEFFEQASLFYNSQTQVEKEHMLVAATFELGNCFDVGVKQRMRDLWNEMDHDFATAFAKNVGISPPGAPKHVNKGAKSTFLSMIASPYTPGNSIATRKIACIVGDGFRMSELTAWRTALKAEMADLMIVGMHAGKIFAEGTKGAEAFVRDGTTVPEDVTGDGMGESITPDFTIDTCKSVLFDAVVLIGGTHVQLLQLRGENACFVAEAMKHCKAVAATSESIQLVEFPCKLAGIAIADPTASTPVVSQGVVTGAMSKDLCAAFINEAKKHRAWTRNVKPIPA